MKKKPTKFRYHYLMRMPMTQAVTCEEGGDWIALQDFHGKTIHSIRFIGGHEWDAFNGWRSTNQSSSAGKGVNCRTSALRDAPKAFVKVDDCEGYSKPRYRVQMGRLIV